MRTAGSALTRRSLSPSGESCEAGATAPCVSVKVGVATNDRSPSAGA
jgi:hypothetical protein